MHGAEGTEGGFVSAEAIREVSTSVPWGVMFTRLLHSPPLLSKPCWDKTLNPAVSQLPKYLLCPLASCQNFPGLPRTSVLGNVSPGL